MLNGVGDEVGIHQDGVRGSESCVVLEEHGRRSLGTRGLLVFCVCEAARDYSRFSDQIILGLLLLFLLVLVLLPGLVLAGWRQDWDSG